MQLRQFKKIWWFLKTRSVIFFCLDECLCNQTESIFVFLSCGNQAGLGGGVGDKSGLGDIFLSFFFPFPCIQLWSPLSFERTTLPGTMEAEL